jgi:hypothetical protein
MIFHFTIFGGWRQQESAGFGVAEFENFLFENSD